jgi:hypothetical protein
MTPLTDEERIRRWRLILGGGKADGIGLGLGESDLRMDAALDFLYGEGEGGGEGNTQKGKNRRGGMESSKPNVARWLGDIRDYFPTPIVRVMQQDAMSRLGLHQLLLEPEILETIEPDVHLVANLLSLNKIMPNETRATARVVVRKVVEELLRKLTNPTRQAVMGSLNRAMRNRRPRHNEMDWNRTIRTNLKHYQPEYKTVIPETRIGYGRKRSALRDIILCIDQSGSMATSVVYASIFGAVLASLPAIRTHLIVFDTSIVDLTAELQDPVELLFGTQLGGGTNINLALTYCQQLIRRPQETILVLISDLYEGGNPQEMLRRAGDIASSGVQFITLLALNDDGAPSYDGNNAAKFAEKGIPSFACTPDLFPDLMAAALNRKDIMQWAAKHDIQLSRGE